MVFCLTLNFDGLSLSERSQLRYGVFGRLSVYKPQKVVYYYPGILDNVRFGKVSHNQFVIEKPVRLPSKFGERIIFGTLPTNYNFETCKTGREALVSACKARGVTVANMSKAELYGVR